MLQDRVDDRTLIIAGDLNQRRRQVGCGLGGKVHQRVIISADPRGHPVDTHEATECPPSGCETMGVGDAGVGIEVSFGNRWQPSDGHSRRRGIVCRDQYHDVSCEGLAHDPHLGIAGNLGDDDPG